MLMQEKWKKALCIGGKRKYITYDIRMNIMNIYFFPVNRMGEIRGCLFHINKIMKKICLGSVL